MVTKTGESANRKDLGEEISEIVLRRDVLESAHRAVAKELDPFLTTIDVLELGALSRVVREDAGGLIVRFKDERERKFHPHFFHGIRQG